MATSTTSQAGTPEGSRAWLVRLSPPPGGFCRLLQLAATDRDAGTVLDHLAYQSMRAGAAGLYGRLDAPLVGPLSGRRTWVRFHEGRFVAHSPREEIVYSILSGEALLTRLDGEWW